MPAVASTESDVGGRGRVAFDDPSSAQLRVVRSRLPDRGPSYNRVRIAARIARVLLTVKIKRDSEQAFAYQSSRRTQIFNNSYRTCTDADVRSTKCFWIYGRVEETVGFIPTITPLFI